MADVEVRPEDALQVARNALAKANQFEDEYADRVEDLHERVVALELRLSELDEDRSYQERTLDEKIGMVRQHAFEKAASQHGKAALDYNAIMWEVFDGEPGAKHCYKLMRRAAGLKDDQETGGRVPGFKVRDPENGSYQLAIDAAEAKETGRFFPENKTATEGEG